MFVVLGPLSASPLACIETDFAVDSTGFATTRYKANTKGCGRGHTSPARPEGQMQPVCYRNPGFSGALQSTLYYEKTDKSTYVNLLAQYLQYRPHLEVVR